MIYLTVGTYPGGFDRLVKKIDELCEKHKIKCLAQIGTTSYKPKSMQFKDFFNQDEHLDNIIKSQFIVTHGGFGIIGDIMRLKKQMLVVPRNPREGPNDQREMAKRLTELFNLNLCMNIDNIEPIFTQLINAHTQNLTYNLETNIPHIISDFLKQS